MSNPELINRDNNDIDAIEKLSRKDKILYFLKKRNSELSRDELSERTKIDFTNLSKILSALENEGKITRRYEQIGRSKYCYVSLLTNSQSTKTNSQLGSSTNSLTSSQKTKTNSQIETIDSTNKLVLDQEEHLESKGALVKRTNSQSTKTNSQLGSSTNSQIEGPRDFRLFLTEENLINFVKAQERTKVYEMKIRFLDNSSLEIKKLVDSLKKRNILTQDKNGWIYLKLTGEKLVDKSLFLNPLVEPRGNKSSAEGEGTPPDTDSKPVNKKEES
jgi:predicted transcriptional regulator